LAAWPTAARCRACQKSTPEQARQDQPREKPWKKPDDSVLERAFVKGFVSQSTFIDFAKYFI
jgi:hypothetical protein